MRCHIMHRPPRSGKKYHTGTKEQDIQKCTGSSQVTDTMKEIEAKEVDDQVSEGIPELEEEDLNCATILLTGM